MFGRCYFKSAVSFLFFIAFISIAAPAEGFGQEKEPVFINLGDLARNTNYSSPEEAEYYTAKYSVPAGKRLVIEQIFAEIRVPLNVKAHGKIRIDTSYSWGSNSQYIPITLTNQGTDEGDKTVHNSSQLMKLYINNPANSGYTKKVSFMIWPQSNGYSSGTNIAFSGYLEDMP